ncbi:hypothetical protein GN244_ATG14088 [Phytophthora infestans]|uniref:Uncharacterized protein n=1 Tax=Phytophthora infestans TaxID=4787 RepID=A0A833SG08_PHYIN|nr:hypothetical protein GN244_ATG14088 [Phytophthora infestans]
MKKIRESSTAVLKADPRSDMEQSPGRSDGAAESRGEATMRMRSETDVLHELYADETGERERGRTEADVDIKTEVKD